MFKHCILLLVLIFTVFTHSQSVSNKIIEAKQDPIQKRAFFKHLGNGFLPTSFFNFDLRYLIKYNQFEGIRTGLGGITNNTFSNLIKLNGYTVYGFKDHRFKYSIGTSIKLAQKTNTWINIGYTNDIQETGSTSFLTDKRLFQFFEPRLLNIDLFHKHVTKTISIQHQLTQKLETETQFSVSNIDPTYNYQFIFNNHPLNSFHISKLTVAIQWSPFIHFNYNEGKLINTTNSYPKFTVQFTNSFKNVFKSNINFTKLNLRAIHKIHYKNKTHSDITLVSGVASENTPLQFIYHAYPNNIQKETIMQRFSVAGLNSFETMFFNEFFSDKFMTFQLKHYVAPFNISKHFKPQLVLITRYALGNIKHPERHLNVTFNSLKKGYTESGLELNKLLFGFGLSATYRHGAYHLPKTGDNIALKFTFNLTL